MRLKIGESAKIGMLLGLSKRGNLRKARIPDEALIGVAVTKLVRGRFAYDTGGGRWRMEGLVDAQLTAISASYGRAEFLSEQVLPNVQKKV